MRKSAMRHGLVSCTPPVSDSGHVKSGWIPVAIPVDEFELNTKGTGGR